MIPLAIGSCSKRRCQLIVTHSTTKSWGPAENHKSIEKNEITQLTCAISSKRDLARLSFVARIIPSKASVWCSRASIASMYPLGGPRFLDGPRKVQAELKSMINLKERGVIRNAQDPLTTQFLQGSLGFERSHLHLDFRHWSQAVKKYLFVKQDQNDMTYLCYCDALYFALSSPEKMDQARMHHGGGLPIHPNPLRHRYTTCDLSKTLQLYEMKQVQSD